MTLARWILWTALLLVANPCWSQTSRPVQPPTSRPADAQQPEDTGDKSGDGVLAGPTVPQDAETGPAFEGSQRGGRPPVVVPLNRWLRVYNGLDLTAEQKAEAQDLVVARHESRKLHQQEYGERIGELQRQARRARQAGEAWPQELRVELERIRRLAPAVTEFQQTLWALLDVEQQERMREQLKAVRRTIEARRAAQRDGMSPLSSDRLPHEFDEAGRRRLEFLMSRRRVRD